MWDALNNNNNKNLIFISIILLSSDQYCSNNLPALQVYSIRNSYTRQWMEVRSRGDQLTRWHIFIQFKLRVVIHSGWCLLSNGAWQQHKVVDILMRTRMSLRTSFNLHFKIGHSSVYSTVMVEMKYQLKSLNYWFRF